MKTINSVWHICRDGWVFEIATKDEVALHLFGMSHAKFTSIIFKEVK